MSALALVSVGQGAVVNVDFQGWNGVLATSGVGAVLASEGGIWNVNGEESGAEVPLVDSTGVGTGLVLWTDGFTGKRLAGDALFSDYLVGEVELRGLVPGMGYELVAYSAANTLTIPRFAGLWTPRAGSAGPADDCLYGDPVLPGVEGCDYFHGVAVADGAGVIGLQVNFGGLAGLQLRLPEGGGGSGPPNPEPGILLLQALAAVMGMFRRRR